MLKKIKKLYATLLNLEKNINKQQQINFFKQEVLVSKESGLAAPGENEEKIIVSLTTYSKRTEEVYLTIESIFKQTRKADKIILWLDESEYTEETIPLILKYQIKRGLEIRYCRNIKSYKKLIPTLKLFSNDIVITIDDDALYPFDFIEKLYLEHKKNPETVLCNIGRLIPKNIDLQKQYKNWEYSNIIKEPRLDIVPIGVGGVLYPPNCFSDEVLNDNLFMQLAPNADDIWFKAMTLKKGIKSMVIGEISNYLQKLMILENNQDMALFNKNITENDIQISNIFDKYNLWQKLKS